MDDNQLGASSPEEGLTVAVTEIERSAAQLGWDRASTVYALVPTGELLELDELPADMRNQLESTWDHSPHTLTAVIQEDLPGTDLEETLAQLGWPESVLGAAVCTERVMVPPEVQDSAPEDPQEAVEYFANHPDRDEVRIVTGVLRSGESWCAVRTRSHDEDDEVAQGMNLVPGLVDALLATFAPAQARDVPAAGGCGCGSGGGGCGCGSGGCGC
ncbi:PPA1309 family protein [Gleimia hominis]|uniref:PPA1309 family protein n=1 Tax=Gleimia hominis TaxID=595468 RepID=UPI000C7FE387|nr:PPA1309 family protein [Gleimia hominis]WIK63690.1 PPA1309 family protein [Gleimia hominis]